MRPRLARLACLAALSAVPACLGAGPYLQPTTTSDSDASSSDSDPTGPGPVCGNGTLDPGEQCDDGNQIGGDGCENDCKTTPPPTCPNGALDDGEECDDGNKIDGDGCESNCTNTPIPPMCGDGKLDPGEQCDDGNTDNSDACLNTCKSAACGDGLVWAGTEPCDDGNADDTDACLSTCQPATCGDGFVQAGVEACDDGPANDDSAYGGCTTQCAPGPRCGDSVVQKDQGEGCDDGSPDGDDLCNACQETPRRYVFATAATYSGKIGSTAAADGLCVLTAGMNDVGTPNAKWTAWLSDSVNSAAGRYTNQGFAGWYVLPGDPPVLVAKGWAGLTSGQLVNPIDKNELGNPLPPGATAWSATAIDGNLGDLTNHCMKWNNNANGNAGRIGDVHATSSEWTDKANMATATCDTLQHIYCIEN